MTSLQGEWSELRLVITGQPLVSASFGITWGRTGRDKTIRDVHWCIFTVVFMSTSSSSRFLLYFTEQLTAGSLIDANCQLRMASVLSGCVLCSPHHHTCRFPRSPRALHSPPHIKASLISATLIFIHPMIIHLRLVVTCGTCTCQLSVTSVVAAIFCISKRMRSNTQSMLNADLLLMLWNEPKWHCALV